MVFGVFYFDVVGDVSEADIDGLGGGAVYLVFEVFVGELSHQKKL